MPQIDGRALASDIDAGDWLAVWKADDVYGGLYRVVKRAPRTLLDAIYASAAQGALADTAVQPGSLAAVATSGNYSDLSGLPTLGTAAAADTGDFATAAQGALAASALQPAAIGVSLQAYNGYLAGIAALTPGAPEDGYALTWDNGAGAYVLSLVGSTEVSAALATISVDDANRYLLTVTFDADVWAALGNYTSGGWSITVDGTPATISTVTRTASATLQIVIDTYVNSSVTIAATYDRETGALLTATNGIPVADTSVSDTAGVVVFDPTAISGLFAWFDISDINNLYQDAAKTTPVASNNDPIGALVDQSGNSKDATQSTTSKKPLYKLGASDNSANTSKDYVYHDRVDDVLEITTAPADTYTVGIAAFTGSQIYTQKQNTTGKWSLNAADIYQKVIVTGSLSAGDETALSNWLDDQREVGNANDVWRVWTSNASVNLAITESGSAGATWELGDGQTATGTSCVKTLGSAPNTIILRATTKTNIRVINWSTKNLFGQIPSLSELTALQEFYCHANKLTGSVPILTGLTALQYFYCHANLLTGSVPTLTGLTALRQFYCYSNQLTDSIPSLTGLTALQKFYCHSNQLTDSIPSLTGLTALQEFYCLDNQLTGYTASTIPTTLIDFEAQNNLLTQAAVDQILSDFVAAGHSNGILNLGGTGNATPSAAGLTDKATLQGRGWTVTTN